MRPATRLKLTSAAILGLLLVAGWSFAELQIAHGGGRFVATNGTYTDPEGRTFKLAGICSVDIRTVSCWDVNGNPEPKLTRRITKRVETENGGFLELRFQGKSFLVVVDGPAGQSPNLSWGLSVVDGQRGIGPNYSHGTGQEIEKIQRVYASNEATTVSIRCNETIPFPSNPILLLKHGSTTSIDGLTLTFDKVLPHVDQFTRPKGSTYRLQKSWDYLIDLSGSGSQPNSLLLATGISASGDLVSASDADGNPLPKAPKNSIQVSSTQLSGLAISQETFSGKKCTFSLAVNPHHIRGLQISGQFNREIDFEQLPLSPRSGKG